jgi:hypothetical protein
MKGAPCEKAPYYSFLAMLYFFPKHERMFYTRSFFPKSFLSTEEAAASKRKLKNTIDFKSVWIFAAYF